MLDDHAIDEIVVQFDGWKSQKMVVALKSLEGKQFIDARKWVRSEDGSTMRPNKGIMLSVKDWPKAIEMIQEMLARHIKVK